MINILFLSYNNPWCSFSGSFKSNQECYFTKSQVVSRIFFTNRRQNKLFLMGFFTVFAHSHRATYNFSRLQNRFIQAFQNS